MQGHSWLVHLMVAVFSSFSTALSLKQSSSDISSPHFGHAMLNCLLKFIQYYHHISKLALYPGSFSPLKEPGYKAKYTNVNKSNSAPFRLGGGGGGGGGGESHCD